MLLVKRTPGDWPARFVSPVGIFHCSGARDPEEERDRQQMTEASGPAEPGSFLTAPASEQKPEPERAAEIAQDLQGFQENLTERRQLRFRKDLKSEQECEGTEA